MQAVPSPPVRMRRGSGERGTAAVEFALVLPLLLVLTLALVQVGLLARDRLLVEAGGRALPPSTLRPARSHPPRWPPDPASILQLHR